MAQGRLARQRDAEVVSAAPRTFDDYALASAPGHLIRRAQQRAVDLFVEEVGDDGPTPRQFAILLTIRQNDGINQTDLVRRSGIDRSTLTEILRRLVDRGLVSRRRTEHDQRTNALSMMPAGVAALERAFDAMVRAQARIIAPIPPARRAEAMEVLALLAGDDGR